MDAYCKFIGLSMCLACSLYAVDANLGEVTAYGKADLSTTEGTGSYTTGNMSTATGLNLSIRETPQSVSVVSNQLIKDLNLKDVDTAMNYASGITLYRDSGRDRIVSRGFNIDNIQEDGVASSVSITAQGTLGFSKEFTDLEFYDRVEVLRGVAGLTQSNGEPGGTVNLVRKRPGDELGINLGLSMGSWNNYRGSFDVTDALNTDGTIRGRLIGILNKTGSFKNHKNGHREALGSTFEFDLTDKTMLTTGLIWQRTLGVYDIYGVPASDAGGNLLNLSRKSYFGSSWDKSEYEKFNAFTELSHQLSDDTKIYAKLNYTKSEGMFKFGAMGGTNPYNVAIPRPTHNVRFRKYDNESDEVNLQIGADGKYELFGRKHEFFVNGSLSREKFTRHDKWAPNASLSSLGIGLYNWNSSAIAEPNWNGSTITDDDLYTTKIYQRAFGIGTRYNFTDDWHLLVGGRFTSVKYDKKWDDLKNHTSKKTLDLTKNHFAPYAGLTWDFAKNHSWYVSYAEIFKPQSATDANKNILKPIVGYNVETGVKSEYFDGALNTAVALFQVVQENRAIQDPLNTTNSIAEGKVRSRGLDLEISGALTDRWNLFAGYTFNKSVYMKNEKKTSTNVNYDKGANAKSYVPKHLFKIYTSYEIPFSSSQKLSFGTGVRWQSATSGFYQNVAYVAPTQKAYALWDANVNYFFNKNFSLGLAVKNITDKKYFMNTQNRTAGMNNFYGDPRNFTLTFNYTY